MEVDVSALGSDGRRVFYEGYRDGEVVRVEGIVGLPFYGCGEVGGNQGEVWRSRNRERVGGGWLV